GEIDVEQPPELIGLYLPYGSDRADDACVVDEYVQTAKPLAYQGCSRLDALNVGDVDRKADLPAGMGRDREVPVQDSGTGRTQTRADGRAEAAETAGDNRDLARKVIGRGCPGHRRSRDHGVPRFTASRTRWCRSRSQACRTSRPDTAWQGPASSPNRPP